MLSFGVYGICLSWGQSNVNYVVCYCHQEGSQLFLPACPDATDQKIPNLVPENAKNMLPLWLVKINIFIAYLGSPKACFSENLSKYFCGEKKITR
jgi:hypothetical protein